jgi:hypothetical protein
VRVLARAMSAAGLGCCAPAAAPNGPPPPACLRLSEAEQNEVEQAFLTSKALSLPYIIEYWIGARTFSAPYYWNWTDYAVPGINVTYYVHWGTVQADGERGPNMTLGNCAIAMQRKAYGSPGAWGWEAASCGSQNFLMCKIMRGWRRAAAAGAALARPAARSRPVAGPAGGHNHWRRAQAADASRPAPAPQRLARSPTPGTPAATSAASSSSRRR